MGKDKSSTSNHRFRARRNYFRSNVLAMQCLYTKKYQVLSVAFQAKDLSMYSEQFANITCYVRFNCPYEEISQVSRIY